MSADYQFTVDWFSRFGSVWSQLLAKYPVRSAVEIGSYEGRTSCFLIEQCGATGPFELNCVDTWLGGVETDPTIMGDVERRFDHNVRVALARAAHPVKLHKHKALSSIALVSLLAQGGWQAFDLIYVDGSHQAPDVLSDAVLAFHLLKVGGLLIFDDYLWAMEAPGLQDHYNMPKPAIDAFMNIYQRKLSIIGAPLYQLYARKIAA